MAEDTRDTNQSHGEEGNPRDSLEQPLETLKSEGDNTVKSPGKTDENGTNQTTADLTKHEVDTSNLHYEGNACIYTDPATKYQYIWNSEKNEWEFKPDGTLKGVENEAQNKASKNIPTVSSTAESNIVSENEYDFDGESYCHTDPRTGITYKYDNVKNKWIPKNPKELDNQKESDEKEDEDKDDNGVDNQKKSDDKDNENKDDDGVVKQDMTAGSYGYEGDTHTYTDAKDGTVYIWDREKNAWFPKVDEDFLAHYQMNYGFTDTSVTPAADSNSKVEPKQENTEDISGVKRKAPQEPSWFEMDDQHNTKVYVSNLPLDITEQEFVDLMQKCGLVMKDADTGKMKIKLYTEPGTSYLKGDGLCTYIKIESVDLALKLLDGYVFRGNKLTVERAKFQMKGSYDPNLKPKKKRKKDKEKLKKIQEKLFDWRPDKLRGERSKHESVVIVKNLFDPSIFDKEVSLILEYQQELREECIKCGVVKRVIVYDRHPEGVAQVTFKEPEAADACVALLNGRWFGKRKITAETWDGKTKYKVVETEEEKLQRIQKWEKFLESEAGKSGNQPKNRERFSPIKTDVPDPKNKKAGKTISENTTNGKLNKHEIVKNTEVEKTDKCDVESSSDFLIEEDTRSSAGSSDDTDDEGSKASENG